MKLNENVLGNKRKDYLSWDEFFMGLSKLAAGRSKDPSTQVGACIVSKDGNYILSIGYNGAPRNWSDDSFPWNREGKSFETKYPYVCHAERNAILNYHGSRMDLEGAKIYVDLFPCNECAKEIAQVGIKEVIYLSDKYKDSESTQISKLIFDNCGISYRQLNLENQKTLYLSLKPDDPIKVIQEEK